jgi:hypothetical protein
MMITPGVPLAGGVTMTTTCCATGVGVKVGNRVRVGMGVATCDSSKLAAEQAQVVKSKTKNASQPP